MTDAPRPPAWAVLEAALLRRCPVQATYHDRTRLLCPHAIGWKNGRPKVLAYQIDTTTDPRHHWRSMFIDEIHDAVVTTHPWQTATNYSPDTNGITELHLRIPKII